MSLLTSFGNIHETPRNAGEESEEGCESPQSVSEPQKCAFVPAVDSLCTPGCCGLGKRLMSLTSLTVQRLENRISHPAPEDQFPSVCLLVTSLLQSVAHCGARGNVPFLEGSQKCHCLDNRLIGQGHCTSQQLPRPAPHL